MYIFTDKELYIAMDQDSGGYPYATENFMSVKVWGSKQDALDYKDRFSDAEWQLRELRGLDFSPVINA